MPDGWRWGLRSVSQPSISVIENKREEIAGPKVPFGFSRALVEHLACDGPSNGQYITGDRAISEGYTLDKWPTGEVVWMQPNVKEAQQDV